MAKDDKKPDIAKSEEEITSADKAVDEFIKDIMEESTSDEDNSSLKSETESKPNSDQSPSPKSESKSKPKSDPKQESEPDPEAKIEETIENANEQITVKSDKGTTISVKSDQTIEVTEDTENSSETPSNTPITPDVTPPTTPTQDEAITKTSEPISTTKKKSKAPLVIFLCLLIVAIGGVITWLILRSTPEAQVSDAMTNLLTAKQVSTTGSINLKFDEATNPDIRTVKLDLGISSDHIPASTSATLSVTTQSNSTFKLDLGETIARDGTIYIKISGLKKAIDNAKVPDEVQVYLDYFSDVIEATDDQWWMIAVPDLLDQLSNSLDNDLSVNYADAYQCILDKIADNDGTELANLYRQYPFIDVSNYTGQLQPTNGGTIFSISINQTKLTSFQNELENTTYQKDLKKCTAQISASSSIDDTYEEQLEDTFDTLADLPPAYVEVTGFDHKLSRFYYTYETDGVGSLEIDLHFSFPNTVSIDMPTKARAITELIDAMVDDFNSLLYDMYSGYYPNYSVDCTSSTNNCIENVYTN